MVGFQGLHRSEGNELNQVEKRSIETKVILKTVALYPLWIFEKGEFLLCYLMKGY